MDGLIETEIGQIRYNLTNANHVCLIGDVKCNRVEFRVSLHLYFDAGAWVLRRFDDRYCRRPYSVRRDDHVSFPTQDKAQAILEAAWGKTVTDELRLVAHQAFTDREVELTEAKLCDLDKQVNECKKYKHDLLRVRDRLP